MILGHVASAILLKRFCHAQSSAGLLIGSLFPDLGDKTIKQIRHLKEGRSFFHSLFGSVITIAVARILLPRRYRRGFIIGYIGHIAVDAPKDIPWFYPFRSTQFGYTPYSYREKFLRQFTHPKFWETFLILWSIGVTGEALWHRARSN